MTLGRYELVALIGRGGMAEVHLAVQRGPAGFEKLVVVKLVHAELASQASFVEMLADEARHAGLVKHPNVVEVYELGEADGRRFIAMEYLEGEPLLDVLRLAGEGAARLDPAVGRAGDRRRRRGARRGAPAEGARRPAARARPPRRLARQHRRALQRAREARRLRRGEGAERGARRRAGAGQARVHVAGEDPGRGGRPAQRSVVARLRAVGGAHAAAAVQGRHRQGHRGPGARGRDPAAVGGRSERPGRARSDRDARARARPGPALPDREGDGGRARGGAARAQVRRQERFGSRSTWRRCSRRASRPASAC